MAFGKEKEATVPLTLYTDLLAKYDALVQVVATMRQAGFQAPGKVKVTDGPPEPETVAVRRAEDEMVTEMAKHFELLGAPSTKAREEAERIRAELTQPFMQST